MTSVLLNTVLTSLLSAYGAPDEKGHYRLSIATFPTSLQLKYKKDWSLFVQELEVNKWLADDNAKQQLLNYYAGFTSALAKKGKKNIFRPGKKVDLLNLSKTLLQPNLIIAGAQLNGVLLSAKLTRLRMANHKVLTADCLETVTSLNLVRNFSFSGLVIYQSNGKDKVTEINSFIKNDLTRYLGIQNPPILLVNPPTWLTKQQVLTRPLSTKVRWFPLVRKPNLTVFLCRTKDNCLVVKYHINVNGLFFAPYRLNLPRLVSQQIKRWWNQCFSPN